TKTKDDAMNDGQALNVKDAVDTRKTLNLDSAAKILGVGRQTAYKLVREGKFPGALHVGRRIVVSREQLDRFLSGRDAETYISDVQ
ncbi:MAG: helix-turn-helix domain-containing protein, partial [Pirellulaceae bacterium]|nr:helix-turn-helix domain-containing protein [Pirellulaceae bacterium]